MHIAAWRAEDVMEARAKIEVMAQQDNNKNVSVGSISSIVHIPRWRKGLAKWAIISHRSGAARELQY